MSDRYARQSVLSEIGSSGQAALARGRVLCIGAGGLGCAALPYLAGAGVGRITVIDHDRVERANLHRQVLFTEADLGRPKAEVAAHRLSRLNPDIEIRPRAERLHAGNVEALFGEHDVIIDGSDNFATKYLAGDASVKFSPPLVYGSATGLEAMVTTFRPGSGPCLRCLFPGPPGGWVPNCAEAGVLGPLVGAAGCMQATEAIKLLGGGAGLEPLVGHLWILDGRDGSVRRLSLKTRPDCPTCSGARGDIVLSGPRDDIREIGPEGLRAEDFDAIVDVRELAEFEQGHIPGAENRPLSALQAGRMELPEVGRCLVYCESGNRSRQAIEADAGGCGRELINLCGGIRAWRGDEP